MFTHCVFDNKENFEDATCVLQSTILLVLPKASVSYGRHYNRGSSSNIPVELTLGCCWAPLVNLAASLLMVGKLGWVCSLDTRAAKEGPSPGWMRLLALSHLRHYYSHKTGKWQTSEIFCLVFLLSVFSELKIIREWNKPSRTWRSNVKKPTGPESFHSFKD